MSNDNDQRPGLLCACCLGVVVGIVWGLGLLLLGIATVYTETYGHKMVDVLGSIYYGYSPGTWAGALLGLVWGFADGFVATFIIIALYNVLIRCCRGCCMCRADKGASNPDITTQTEV